LVGFGVCVLYCIVYKHLYSASHGVNQTEAIKQKCVLRCMYLRAWRWWFF